MVYMTWQQTGNNEQRSEIKGQLYNFTENDTRTSLRVNQSSIFSIVFLFLLHSILIASTYADRQN